MKNPAPLNHHLSCRRRFGNYCLKDGDSERETERESERDGGDGSYRKTNTDKDRMRE